MAQIEIGNRIFENFEVLELLGAGSLVRAYRCRDDRNPVNNVVVKVLFEEAGSNSAFVEQLKTSVSDFKRVHHPNVVQVFEILEGNSDIGYSTEYVNSGDLVEKIEGKILPIESCKILCEIAKGLQAIHDYGLIHRNLKPEKILHDSTGAVKIAESSVGRRTGDSERPSDTGVSATISYVPPEYILSSQIDERSDIYGLGILGYELLTGQSPFSGDTVYETMKSCLKSNPTSPSKINELCPSELGEVILRAMHQDPDARFQTASEFGQAIADFLSSAT